MRCLLAARWGPAPLCRHIASHNMDPNHLALRRVYLFALYVASTIHLSIHKVCPVRLLASPIKIHKYKALLAVCFGLLPSK